MFGEWDALVVLSAFMPGAESQTLHKDSALRAFRPEFLEMWHLGILGHCQEDRSQHCTLEPHQTISARASNPGRPGSWTLGESTGLYGSAALDAAEVWPVQDVLNKILQVQQTSTFSWNNFSFEGSSSLRNSIMMLHECFWARCEMLPLESV